MGGGVGQAEGTRLVVLPAEEELSVEDVLGQRYGVRAEGDAIRAGAGVVVAAAGLGCDHDRGQRVGGVLPQSQRGAAGGEARDRCVRQLNEELDRDGVGAGQQAQPTGREQVGENREVHCGESGILCVLVSAGGPGMDRASCAETARVSYNSSDNTARYACGR